MMALRWEKQGDGDAEYAWSGEVVIGMIGTRTVDRSRWWWTAHNGVHIKGISKTHGEVSAPAAARRAVERSWARWCEVAGLRAAAAQPEPIGRPRREGPTVGDLCEVERRLSSATDPREIERLTAERSHIIALSMPKDNE